MFGQKLEEAVKSVGGGHAAILMGFDGIPVDKYSAGDEPDIEIVGMEFSVLLKEVRKASEMLDAGTAEELMVRTEKMSTILRVINEEYFIALAVHQGGNIGKARYLLRIMAPVMRAELT